METIKRLAKYFDSLLKLNGFLEIFDGPIFEAILTKNYNELHKFNPDLGVLFLTIAEDYLESVEAKDEDEAAYQFGQLMRLLVYKKV